MNIYEDYNSYIVDMKNLIKILEESKSPVFILIEDALNVEEQFRFGFGGSANLITLIRTPNNSLPLFWLDKGRSHNAPFPR